MKTKLSIATLFVILTLLVWSVSPALAFPPVPSGFWGTVSVDGSDVPDGTPIAAMINGIVYANTVTTTFNGHSGYGVLVPGDDLATVGVIEGGVTGDSVFFRVGSRVAVQHGTWASGPNVNLNLVLTPTAATVANFSATPQLSSVLLSWQTAIELDLVGFNMYRSESISGLKQKLNVNLIPADKPGQMLGAHYQIVDTVSQGHQYFYWLEIVSVDGSGPTLQIEIITQHLRFLPIVN
jgi:hypothetical protein